MKDLTALLLALALCLPLSACSSPDPGTPAGESVPIPESSAASSEAELPQEENSSLPEEEPEIEEEPAADLLPEVEAMAYLFDVQVVLDSLTADLEQYSRLCRGPLRRSPPCPPRRATWKYPIWRQRPPAIWRR